MPTFHQHQDASTFPPWSTPQRMCISTTLMVHLSNIVHSSTLVNLLSDMAHTHHHHNGAPVYQGQGAPVCTLVQFPIMPSLVQAHPIIVPPVRTMVQFPLMPSMVQVHPIIVPPVCTMMQSSTRTSVLPIRGFSAPPCLPFARQARHGKHESDGVYWNGTETD